MKYEDVKQKELSLKHFLKNLAKDNLDFDSVSLIEDLQKIYENPDCKIDDRWYRHSYSEIFTVILEIQKDQNSDLDLLLEKLRTIYLDVQKGNYDKGFRLAVYKLQDHVNLDVSRLIYFNDENQEWRNSLSSEREEVKNQVREARSDLENFKQDLKKQETDLKERKDEISHIRGEFVAILGIFSAIVIACFSDVVYSSQLLSNLSDTATHKILIASSVIGFVAFLTIWLVYVLLDKVLFSNRKKRRSFIESFCNWKTMTLNEFLSVLALMFLIFVFLVGICQSLNQKQIQRDQIVPEKTQSSPDGVVFNQQINIVDDSSQN